MVELQDVSFSYTKDAGTLTHVDLTIRPGECVLLCGASGCGKTTITKLVNGLIPAFTEDCTLTGQVLLHGAPVREQPLYQLARQVGSVFQNPKSQFFNLDSDSELAFGLENQGVARGEILRRLDDTTDRLHLKRLRGRNIFAMSGGEKQLLAFASVYAMGPKLYILDEPTANLDRETIERLHDQIAYLKSRGHTILIAEHRLYFLADLIDRAVYLRDGIVERIWSGAEFRRLAETERIALGLRTLTPTQVTLPPSRAAGEQDGLSVEGLCCRYKREPPIFQNLSFSARPGEVLAVTGDNGVGKSTLSRCLCGLMRESAGTIRLNGRILGAKQRQRIAYCVMQDVNHQLFSDSVWGECQLAMLAHVSAYTILEGLRRQVAHKLMHAPLGSVLSKPVGSLKSTIVDRIEGIEPPLAHMIPELSSNVLLPIVVVIALFAMDWRMGLASLATIPAALIPMAAGLRTYNEKYAAYMEANAQVNSIIVEYVEGIEVVKAFNQSGASYEKFVRAVTSFRDFTLDWFRCTWKSMNLCLSILPTTLLATLPVGIALYQTGVLDPARLALCLMLVLGIVSPLVQAAAFLNSMKSMEFAVRDTRHLLDLEELPEASEPARLSGSGITLRDVSFSYSGKEEDTVLRHIDLELPAGTFTALVGPSGGGKSTAARLIARFWDVTDGCIAIGGVDIRNLTLKQLADQVSFVTQDNFLFDCSLKENIRLGKPDATEEEVWAAARAAQCEEFLGRLEHGWDTPAGEAGKQLSGGERQRIAIARAILKDAPIVILDEATAFTDPENEDKIQRSLMALSRGKTLLVIAHRLSTIQNADQIVVLEKGRIVDKGTQPELLSRCPLYQKLWQAHVGAQNWAVGKEA